MGACSSSPQASSPQRSRTASTSSTCTVDSVISRVQLIPQGVRAVEEDYDLEPKPLGHGSFGVVRKGTHHVTGACRALKIVSTEKACISDLRREAAVMKVMDHPNIIRLHETFEHENHVVFVMELCRGGELFDRVISSGRFSERQAAVVMLQIMRAVSHMQQKDVVHRDLKPENFLLSSSLPIEHNMLKVVDFGTARHCPPGAVLKTLVGTHYYVAPQVLGRRYCGKCDLWSCGAIMYTLLRGQPPFTGKTCNEVLSKVRQANYSLDGSAWSIVSKDAKDLVRMLMHVNPRARFSAPQALKHVWIRRQAPNATAPELPEAIVDNLRTFHEQDRLKKAALQIIAGQLKEERVGKLRDAFLSLDTDGDGMLSMDELREGLERGSSMDEEMRTGLDFAVRGINVECSGQISYTEFLAAALDRGHELCEQDLLSAFRVFDSNGDGRISGEDLSAVLDSGDRVASSNELLRRASSDGESQIDFNEFKSLMGVTGTCEEIGPADSGQGPEERVTCVRPPSRPDGGSLDPAPPRGVSAAVCWKGSTRPASLSAAPR